MNTVYNKYKTDTDLFAPMSVPTRKVETYPDGTIKSETWILNSKFHRLDGPAYREWHTNGKNKYEIWGKDDKLHRLDGPASQTWYRSGKIWSEVWYKNDELHRLDGFAYQEWDTEGKQIYGKYMMNGKEFTDIEYLKAGGYIGNLWFAPQYEMKRYISPHEIFPQGYKQMVTMFYMAHMYIAELKGYGGYGKWIKDHKVQLPWLLFIPVMQNVNPCWLLEE